MKYTRLGNSDLNVSRICMGCMGFGDATRGQHSWTIDEEHSREIIKRGLDLGVNFYDTAIAYQSGTSEQYVGRALRDFAKREDVVVATKFLPRTSEEIEQGITGQQHIENMINTSLQNLGMDYDTAWATTHMFPEQTVQAAIDAHAKWLIPVHWGTFSLANHAWDDPIIRVASAAETKGVNLATPRHGQTIDFAEISVSTEHWWEDNRRTMEGKTLKLRIGETEVSVEWEDNESVKALQALVADKPLTISMSMYGGFEQVGSLGTVLPRQDKEITTEAGDIVLYSGNQIVVFYGSNSWAYTRLGKITDRTASEMKDLLGNGNVSITISAKMQVDQVPFFHLH